MKKYLVISYCILFFQNYIASAQITVRCAGESYSIPSFSNDSVKIQDRNLEKFQILLPINQSKNDIELRGYYITSNPLISSVVVIRGNEEKLTAEAYFYKSSFGMNFKTVTSSRGNTIRSGNQLVHAITKSVQPTDTLLRYLISNKLFSLKDIKYISDSLTKRGVKLTKNSALDPYYMQFELKVKNHYRSFNCDPFMYYSNKNIIELLPEKLLYDQFNQLYEKSGQEKNHLFP